MGFVFYFIGLVSGSTLGVALMCLFQINKKDKDE